VRPVASTDIYNMKWPSDPEISPDGKSVLFTVKMVVEEEKTRKYKTHIWIARDGKARQFSSGPKNDTSPRWSPSGREIAFLSQRDNDKTQIYLISLEGGEARKLTSLKDGVGEPVWSPDGKKIAFAALACEEDEKPRDVEKTSKDGDKGSTDEEKSDVRVINRIRYKMNGRGFLPEKTSQIFVVDVESGTVAQLTSGPYDCREPAWSPDGKKIAFISARFEDHDLSSIRDIWVVDVNTKEMRKVTRSDAVLSSPSWSPDGKLIACYGHDNTFKGATVTGVAVVPTEGGAVTFLTKALELSVGGTPGADMVSSRMPRPAWSSDGQHLYFSAMEKGRTHIYRVGRDSGEVQRVTSGDCAVYGWSKAEECDALALCVTSFHIIGDLFVLSPKEDDSPWQSFPQVGGENSSHIAVDEEFRKKTLAGGSRGGLEVRRLTNLNDDLLSSLYLSIPEAVQVTHADGTVLDAWVMKPIGTKEGVKYPLILEIHGGPHSAYGYAFSHEFQLLTSRGYGVVFGNPRGSTGYGQAFVAATKHDWGGKDYEDVMAIARYAASLPWVDSDRLGVTGGSYGGYMTNWIIGHTGMFKAAVTQRSTCNRMSQFGTSDTAYMNGEFEFDGDPWDNPRAYLDRSPIMYVRNVATPLLMIHSEEDLRCPIGQAEEFFVALKKLKKTCVMVRFPGENHELSRSGKPKHRVERLEYILAWFDRYLSPTAEDYEVIPEPPKVKVKLPETGSK